MAHRCSVRTGQEQARSLGAGDGQPLDHAVIRGNGHDVLVTDSGGVKRNDRGTGEPRLAGSVDAHGIDDRRHWGRHLYRLRTTCADRESDRIEAHVAVRVVDCPAQ